MKTIKGLMLSVLFLLFATPVFSQTPPSLNLSYTDNATNEDGFSIYRCQGAGCDPALTKLLDIGPNVTSYVDAGLAQATTYCYTVDAFNTVGHSGKPPSICAVTQAQLSVAKLGTGLGTMTSAPLGINCGAACAFWFAGNSTVSLTATATAGSVFAGWSGGCSGTGTCSVVMSSAKSVTATFNAITVPNAPTNFTVK